MLTVEMRGRLFRGAMSIFLAYHLLAMTASLGQGLGPIAELRKKVTRPYERTIGVHQNWNMFVPNPARSTEWLEAKGFKEGGTETPVATLSGRPETDGVIWFYERENKFDRNMCDEERKSIRAGYVRWLCRREKEAGNAYTHIQFDRLTQPTPKPDERAGAGPRASWPTKRERLERWRCKP